MENYTGDYDDDLTQYFENIRTTEQVAASIIALLTVVNICLLLTCLSKQCRAISATWYIYSLISAVTFYGLIVCIGMWSPAFYMSTGCVVLHSLSRLMQLLYSSAVVWINIEIYRTVICPKPPWMQKKLNRFCWAIGFTWSISLVIVIILGVYTFQHGCWTHVSWLADIIIHLLKNWLPGIAVIILTTLNIIGYVQLRRQGVASYNQFVENSAVAIRPTEWFVCVTLINGIFLVIEIMFTHLFVIFHYNIIEHLYVVRFLVVMLGFPILALSFVRKSIIFFFRKGFSQAEASVADMHDSPDMNMDAIEDESL